MSPDFCVPDRKSPPAKQQQQWFFKVNYYCVPEFFIPFYSLQKSTEVFLMILVIFAGVSTICFTWILKHQWLIPMRRMPLDILRCCFSYCPAVNEAIHVYLVSFIALDTEGYLSWQEFATMLRVLGSYPADVKVP